MSYPLGARAGVGESVDWDVHTTDTSVCGDAETVAEAGGTAQTIKSVPVPGTGAGADLGVGVTLGGQVLTLPVTRQGDEGPDLPTGP